MTTLAPAPDPTVTDLDRVDAWWRAANYLSVGQIYLRDNPLLRSRLSPEDIKPRLLGHWGTSPGLNLLWALYPSITNDVAGLTRLFRQFSSPGGTPSHASPHTPGSLHEGGELGYSSVSE